MLEGTHYVRYFHEIIMISSSLSWEAFWYWFGDLLTSTELKETFGMTRDVQQSFLSKKRCPVDFEKLCDARRSLLRYYERFLAECSEKEIELCMYLYIS